MQKRNAELIHTFDKNKFVIETTVAERHLVIVTNKGVYIVSLDEKPTLTVVNPLRGDK